MTQPNGTFSYELEGCHPQYEVFIQDGNEVAARMLCNNPGIAHITFHPVSPYQPGAGNHDPTQRVQDQQLLHPPPEDVFSVSILDTHLGPKAQLHPETDNGIGAYVLVWNISYEIRVHGKPCLRLIPECQSARYVYHLD